MEKHELYLAWCQLLSAPELLALLVILHAVPSEGRLSLARRQHDQDSRLGFLLLYVCSSYVVYD